MEKKRAKPFDLFKLNSRRKALSFERLSTTFIMKIVAHKINKNETVFKLPKKIDNSEINARFNDACIGNNGPNFLHRHQFLKIYFGKDSRISFVILFVPL